MNRFDESSDAVLFSERFSFMFMIGLAVKVKLVLTFFRYLMISGWQNLLYVAHREHFRKNADEDNCSCYAHQGEHS